MEDSALKKGTPGCKIYVQKGVLFLKPHKTGRKDVLCWMQSSDEIKKIIRTGYELKSGGNSGE